MDAITPPIGSAIASTREIDRLIAELAARQHDLVARWQLLELGINEKAIDHRLQTRRLRRVRPGVYKLGAARLTRRGRWMADVLACGKGAGLGGDSVLQLLGVRRPNNRKTVVITSKRGRRTPKGIDLRTSRNVEFITWDGIPVTPLPRALADAARDLDDEQLEAALERAIVDHQLHLDSLPKRKPKNLSRLVRDMELGRAMTDSDLENLFRKLIKQAGLPQPLSNRDVWTGERFYRPDFIWPAQRLIVEIDGPIHRSQREADTQRAAHLSALGYTIQRYTRLQLIRHHRAITNAIRPFVSDRERGGSVRSGA